MIAEKHGKKWVIGNPNNLVGQAVTRAPMNQWYIRDHLGSIVYSNSEELCYWSRFDALLKFYHKII